MRTGKQIILTAAVCAVLILPAAGCKTSKPQKTQETAADKTVLEQTQSRGITYNGKQYEYNEHLSNFLFLGVDKREKAETSQGQTDAGQSDAIFLLSWDRVKHSFALVTIPRDTMTDIEAFDTSGKSLGMSKDHISLAYAYGDGDRGSCELAKEAVSNLFYGLPIQGYCALNMDGIAIMTEDIGGLTVTVPDDSLEQKYPEFQEGTEVELTKENTETFVRYRDINESQSAIKRMKRQSVFMDAYAAKASEKFVKNPGFIAGLYEDLKPYMVTNIGADQFAKIMKDASAGKTQERWTVPGEGVEGVSFDEYHTDDAKLYEMILQTFYEEIK